jgi:hypothetical protein
LQVINAAKSAARFDAETWEAGAATLAAVVPAWLRSGRELSELLSSAVSVLPDLAPTRRAPLLQAMLKALPAGEPLRPLLPLSPAPTFAPDIMPGQPGAQFVQFYEKDDVRVIIACDCAATFWKKETK